MTRHLRMQRAIRNSEAGASLILALMFTTAIAFMIAASLDFANSSFGQSNGQTRSRNGAYAAEGSVRTLIAAMRSDAAWGRAETSCNGATLDVGDGRTAATSCSPEPGSGALINSGSGARANRVVNLAGTIDEVTVVRARVLFLDGGGNDPGRKVEILEWSAAL